ncbi:hypothetical protein HJ590_09860 [Naumannella sp. ID2617S]|nr:hypothetical protein [Naumannella sp. ID2617S]
MGRGGHHSYRWCAESGQRERLSLPGPGRYRHRSRLADRAQRGDHHAQPRHPAEPACGHDPAPVVIGTGVWFGANGTVLPGITIGEGSVIGAGAVVTKDVPGGAIVVGVPAKQVRTVPDE